MATTEKPNLYQKLLAITEEIGKIDKTGRNTKQDYTFIEQAQVVAEVRVQLAKHGVMIIPETVSRTLERHDVTRSNGKAGVDVHVNVKSRYTIVNADKPDERMVCEWDAGEAIDSGDKATNKATTASHKYFLMKLFNISDKDDPDADSPVVQPKRSEKLVEARTAPVGTESNGPLIHPATLKALKQAFVDAQITGESAIAFAWATIGKERPTTETEAVKLTEAVKALTEVEG